MICHAEPVDAVSLSNRRRAQRDILDGLLLRNGMMLSCMYEYRAPPPLCVDPSDRTYFRRVHRLAAKSYLIMVALMGLPVLMIILRTERLDLHMAINQAHTTWADPLFKYGTHLADGLVALGIGVVLLLARWRPFLLFAVSTIGSAIVVQLLKHTLFADHDRPGMFLDRMPGLYLLPGVEQLHHNSFPSGHSACAFSMCFALAVIMERRGVAVLLAITAAMLGWSRIYLSQHFAEDVLCGALIGSLVGWLAYRWLYTGTFSRRLWLNTKPFGG